VARRFQVTPQTVGKWRTRFLEKRLAGLTDEPRPGAPRKLSDAAVAVLLTTVLSEAGRPAGRRCTSRELAARLGVSQSTVSRVLRSRGIEPQTTDAYRLSLDPRYISQVRDVVGLYIDDSLRAMVLCVDERPTQPAGTAMGWPSSCSVLPARHAISYPRYGDTTLFEALDHATCGGLGPSARGAGVKPFLAFLRKLESATHAERALHVVLDDKGRRNRPALQQWLARKPRFRLLVAPSCDAWLAQVERWFALLVQRDACGEQDHSADALEDAVRAFLAAAGSAPFSWVKPLSPQPMPTAVPAVS
jgi:transposase